eukprot:snap_masked-scaffold_22-processed-gene-0.38-mRNA-1 protein AED:1.00 eAED:1.00 QI:0/0/0/0/1/1/2/0/60
MHRGGLSKDSYNGKHENKTKPVAENYNLCTSMNSFWLMHFKSNKNINLFISKAQYNAGVV